MWKGPIVCQKKYTKRVPFLSKKVHKRIRGWNRGGASRPHNLGTYPSTPQADTTSTVWASETSLARTCERAFPRSAPRSRVLARLASLAQKESLLAGYHDYTYKGIRAIIEPASS